jgi:hypothetical protein
MTFWWIEEVQDCLHWRSLVLEVLNFFGFFCHNVSELGILLIKYTKILYKQFTVGDILVSIQKMLIFSA